MGNLAAGSWCITFTEPIPIARRMAAWVHRLGHAYALNVREEQDLACPGGLPVWGSTDPKGLFLVDTVFTFVVP